MADTPDPILSVTEQNTGRRGALVEVTPDPNGGPPTYRVIWDDQDPANDPWDAE